jgi:hypothetical protein
MKLPESDVGMKPEVIAVPTPTMALLPEIEVFMELSNTSSIPLTPSALPGMPLPVRDESVLTPVKSPAVAVAVYAVKALSSSLPGTADALFQIPL